MIALIDYGAGNLTSVRKAFAAAGATLYTPADLPGLREATAIVVPGVGHFSATAALEGQWREGVAGSVRRGVPLLGICLGMQWLFEGSEESPGVPGLGVLPGVVFRLGDADEPALKVPHVGWNTLEMTGPSRLLDGVATGTHVYFAHSYAAHVTAQSIATSTHGRPFAAAVEAATVFGVQFHPEKSGDAGVRILRNFVEIAGPATRK